MKALTKDRARRKLNKQPARDKAVARFVETIDYRRLELLLVSNARYHPLLEMLGDPLVFASGKGRMSFAAAMRRADVTLAEVQKLYIDGSKQLCMLEMVNRLPAIGASVAENAINRDESCPACSGTGGNDSTCPSCKGSGSIRIMGDKHAIDTVGRWLDLDSSKSNVTINNLLSQNANFGGGADRVEDLLAKTAQVISVEAREVEADG